MPKSIKILNVLYFAIVLMSSHAWFFWPMPSSMQLILLILIFLYGIIICKKNKSRQFNGKEILILTFFFLAIIWNTKNNIGGLIQNLIFIGLIGILIVQPSNVKNYMLVEQTKWLALLISLSACFWIINIYAKLPSLGLWQTDLEGFSMYNYFFFTTTPEDVYRAFPRFKGIFFEPGHTALLLCFYIIANKYNFKNKYVILLSICIIPTLSLAGFLLWPIGYILTILNKKSITKIFIPLLLTSFIIGGLYSFALFYNGGSNSLKILILDRLILDDNNVIKGNNRTSHRFNTFYKDSREKGELIVGVQSHSAGNTILKENIGAGYKVYIFKQGFIGVFLIGMVYILIALNTPISNRRWAIILFMFYVIAFIQRSYPTLPSWWVPYILGISFHEKNK